MPARKIPLSRIVEDIQSGVSDETLMSKYALSGPALSGLLRRMAEEGLIERSNPATRDVVSEKRIEIKHRSTGDTLFSGIFPNLKAAVSEAVKAKESLSGAVLEGAQLSGSELEGAYFPRANLMRASLEKTDLRSADLCRASLAQANLRKALLQGADLTDADLIGADLTAADLMGANLTGARLTKVRFVKANLANAELTGADLTGADLSHCNLDGAALTASNMTDTRVEGVNFSRVVKDRVALDREKRRKKMDTLVFKPGSFILAQVFFCFIQLLGLAFLGPFMLFWLAGVVMINMYFFFYKNRWWGLGIVIQMAFFLIMWRVVGVMMGKLDSVF